MGKTASGVFKAGLVVVLIAVSLPFIKTQIEKLKFCANSTTCTKDLSGRFQSSSEGIFEGRKVSAPKQIAEDKKAPDVLGEETGKKHIYIDLTNQILYAYEGDNLVYHFLISSGKWWPTPTGDFKIWIKLRATRMAGGNPGLGTYYNLPNVPYTMYFSNHEYPPNRGFGLHGTYWHNNFGNPMSHGCVNLRTEDAEKLYYWTNPSPTSYSTRATANNPGTPITIYGEATPE